MKASATLLLLVLAAAPAGAQSDCADGTIHDDGSFEDGIGSTSVFSAHVVMRLDPPALPAGLDSVCVCWSQTSGEDTALDFRILVWDSDGPDGAPGTLLGSLEDVTASGVPFGAGGQFYRYDLSGLGLELNRPVYVGPAWDSFVEQDFFVCVDENGPATQPAYADTGVLAGVVAPEAPLGTPAVFPTYRTLGVRAVFSEIPGVFLSAAGDLVVPGFEVDTLAADGGTTFWAVANQTGGAVGVEAHFFGREVTDTPLRTDAFTLDPYASFTTDVRFDLSGLDVDEDGVARGLIVVNEEGITRAPDLEGDYFRIDSANAFAAGDRMIRTADFCDRQHLRFLDFGSGSVLRILLNHPLADAAPSFSMEVRGLDGELLATVPFTTREHLVIVDMKDVTDSPFGSLLLDFRPASGGAATARYSAFGLFSVELQAACREEAPALSVAAPRGSGWRPVGIRHLRSPPG